MKKPYLVSQGKQFEIMVYATGPKSAAKRIADFRIGKGEYTLIPTKRPLPSSYKVSLAGGTKTSVTYYDIMGIPEKKGVNL